MVVHLVGWALFFIIFFEVCYCLYYDYVTLFHIMNAFIVYILLLLFYVTVYSREKEMKMWQKPPKPKIPKNACLFSTNVDTIVIYT